MFEAYVMESMFKISQSSVSKHCLMNSDPMNPYPPVTSMLSMDSILMLKILIS